MSGKRKRGTKIVEEEIFTEEPPKKKARIELPGEVVALRTRLEKGPEEREKVRKEYLDIRAEREGLESRVKTLKRKEDFYLQALPLVVQREILYTISGIDPKGESSKDLELLQISRKIEKFEIKLLALETMELQTKKFSQIVQDKDSSEQQRSKAGKKIKNLTSQIGGLKKSIREKHAKILLGRMKRAKREGSYEKERWERLGKKGLIQERFNPGKPGFSSGVKGTILELFPEAKDLF